MIWIGKKDSDKLLVIKNLVKILRSWNLKILISDQESVIVTWTNKKKQLV